MASFPNPKFLSILEGLSITVRMSVIICIIGKKEFRLFASFWSGHPESSKMAPNKLFVQKDVTNEA